MMMGSREGGGNGATSPAVDVLVIGAGIAGLTAAWELSRKGRQVVVLEAQDRPGGNVFTISQGDYRMESGPHSFMGSAESLWALIEQSGLEGETVAALPAADNRFIYRNGRLMALPLSAGRFLTSPLLSFRAKMRLAMEPFVRGGAREKDTAWDFFVRRFGVEAASYIMSPFISGIYAGDIHTLGARAAFPKFWAFEKESGSMIRGSMRYMRAKRKRYLAEGRQIRKGLYSFRGGLGRVTAHLAAELGNRLQLSLAAKAIRPQPDGFHVNAQGRSFECRSLVLAVPPQRASELLANLCPPAAQAISRVPMVPVALVHWSLLKEKGVMPSGFGFLVPREQGLRVLGTLFPSQLFADRAPEGTQLMASYYGGALDPEAAALSDEGLVALLRKDHGRVLGADPGDPEMVRVLRYSHAIPQLLPDHPEHMADALRALERLPGLALAGNYLTGVGIEQAVESGFVAARNTQAYLEGQGDRHDSLDN